MNDDNRSTRPHETADFDARMRYALAQATPVDTIPDSLFRPEPRRRLPLLAICLFAVIGTLIAAGLALQPPPLVQAALSHERDERTVRGIFMPAQTTIASVFGLPAGTAAPGLLQMAKPCVIAGRVAYHLTTWLDGVDGGGIVTAISFAQPLSLAERSGWWPDAYWRIVHTKQGAPVMLFAQNSRAVDAIAVRLR